MCFGITVAGGFLERRDLVMVGCLGFLTVFMLDVELVVFSLTSRMSFSLLTCFVRGLSHHVASFQLFVLYL